MTQKWSSEGHPDIMSTKGGSHLEVSLRGPYVTLDNIIDVAAAIRDLMTVAVGARAEITGVYFKCDGCGLRRPDRPAPDEGWTYRARDGYDLCPECSIANTEETS